MNTMIAIIMGCFGIVILFMVSVLLDKWDKEELMKVDLQVDCTTCKHWSIFPGKVPCATCRRPQGFTNWERVD